MMPIIPPDKKSLGPEEPFFKNNPKPEKTLFQKRNIGISRGEFRDSLRKIYDPKINLSKEERVKLEKELFPYQQYGSDISQGDVVRRISLLEKEKFKSPHTKDKVKIQQEINLLNKLKNQK